MGSNMYKLIIIIAILTLLPFILLFIRKAVKKRRIREQLIREGGDYRETAKNIAESIAKAKALYKELITKVHPDKFSEENKAAANSLASKITKAKKDYATLCKLEKEVNEFITNINSLKN